MPFIHTDTVPAKPVKSATTARVAMPADAIAQTDPRMHNRVSDQIEAIHRGRQSLWRRLRHWLFGT
jgi:hypothetical protein